MRVLFFVLYFTYIKCEESTPSLLGNLLGGRIVGGEAVNITEVPYQVSVQLSGRHICGGAIIASDVIVTAAHCINETAQSYSIRAGSSYVDRDGTVHPVKDIVTYPTYTNNNKNGDVAVIFLSNQLEFSDEVASIALKEADEEIYDGDLMTVTGWGSLHKGGVAPDMLQKLIVPKYNDTVCKKKYYYVITTKMLCAGFPEGGKDTCQGDSGGPLVHQNKLVGIVSFGRGCARPRLPGVYARVSAFRNWIDETVEQLRLKYPSNTKQ